MQTLIVVNPASAAGKTRLNWPRLEDELRNAGVDFEVRQTAGPGDAMSLAREALLQGTPRVVACGGDGTLSEVVNGFIDEAGKSVAPDAVLGMIPSGTGGDFRKTVGIPNDPAVAAALLATNESRQIDAGIVEYADGTTRRFVNIADCGLGGAVVKRLNAFKRKPGSIAYATATLRALATFKPVHTRVEVDGAAIEGVMMSVVAANGQFFGAGMQIAPSADVADGLLDVIISYAGKFKGILDARAVYSGKHIGKPGTFVLRGREVKVTPLDGRPMPFDVDGEQVGEAPGTMRVLPGALKLCAPDAA